MILRVSTACSRGWSRAPTPPPLKAAFITGWRLRSEVLTLTWTQVDNAAGFPRIDVGRTKGREGRSFPITSRLKAIIKALMKAEGCPLVFHENGGVTVPKRLYSAWNAATVAAGCEGMIPHDLRRSAVLDLWQPGSQMDSNLRSGAQHERDFMSAMRKPRRGGSLSCPRVMKMRGQRCRVRGNDDVTSLQGIRTAAVLIVAGAFLACGFTARAGGGQGEPVRAIGDFSNQRFTPEHAYGYAVQLWRQGDRIIGLFSFSNGAQTDLDTVALENVRFEPRTDALTFNSYAGMFRFSGTLRGDTLTGRLVKMMPRGTAGATTEQIVLRRDQEATEFMSDYPTYAEWKRHADDVLRRLVPKKP